MGHRRGNRHRTWRSRTDRQTDRQQSLSLQGRKPARGMPTAASTRRHGLHGLCGQGCELRAVALLLQRGGRALVGEQAGKIPQPRGQCPGWLEKTSQAGKGACMIGTGCQGLLHDCAQEYGMNRSTGESVRGGSSLWIYAKVSGPTR